VLPDDLAAAIRAHRLRRGLGLREAARTAGIPHSHLSMIERGQRAPSLSVAELLCDALRLPAHLAAELIAAAQPHAGRDYPRDGRR
jgi:transcriptional regulator with XRE-family HTH domain